MKLDWGAVDPTSVVPDEALSGPAQILPGVGCRVVMTALADPDNRNENLVSRLYRAAQLLLDTGAAGIASDTTPGYTRIYGGEAPLYVSGVSETAVYTTLGTAILTADNATQGKIKALGIRALKEW